MHTFQRGSKLNYMYIYIRYTYMCSTFITRVIIFERIHFNISSGKLKAVSE